MHELWNSIAARANVALSAEQLAAMERYLDLLLDANTRVNLTRIVDREAARLLHIADSLTLLEHLPAGPHAIADVGSGGGVPGVILAIARPDARIALVESTGKKCAFLSTALRELGLANAATFNARAEALDKPPHRMAYDIVTARAVGQIGELATWCMPLLKPGGALLAMKGPRAADEVALAAADLRRARVDRTSIHPANLPGAEGHVIVKCFRLGGI